MGLIEFQTVLGRMLREQNRDDHVRGVSLEEDESQYLENLRVPQSFVSMRVCSGRGVFRELQRRRI